MKKNRNKWTFGLGTVGRDMMYTMVSMYLMFYLTDVLQLPDDVLWWVTGIILAARVFDAFNDPFMGVIVDNTHSKNGKFKNPQELLNWLKEKSDEIKAPSEITYLYEVLHLLFYIAGYKSNNISLMFEKIDINYYNLMPQIMRMAFGLRFYLQYGENYLKLDRLIDENNAALFNPYINDLLSNEYICSILRNCIDLNIPQLNVKIGLPIEQIIEYWGNCYSFMTLTNTERYGSDIVLNWENLLNPDFSAEEAMERAGIDKFAKGKFKKSNKRGEIVNLSFYDFMMWDVKIKEKTQKEIYFFLANNTSVPWKYEYNRYDKQADEELGKKSIDIFNENYGICIEYQGEQHFRPFGVKGDDDDSIEMVFLMTRPQHSFISSSTVTPIFLLFSFKISPFPSVGRNDRLVDEFSEFRTDDEFLVVASLYAADDLCVDAEAL